MCRIKSIIYHKCGNINGYACESTDKGDTAMKKLLSMNTFITLVVLTYLLFCGTPTAYDFASLDTQFNKKHNTLIRKVHEDKWVIGYRHSSKCPLRERIGDKALQEAITKVLQTWLNPLYNLKTEMPIFSTDNIEFRKQPDQQEGENALPLLSLDLRVTIMCEIGTSIAWVGISLPPDVYMRAGTTINETFMFVLTHEIGHALGLADTYVGTPGEGNRTTSGNLNRTIGTQPGSVMAGLRASKAQDLLSKDDINGIVWLYKTIYEGLATDDCFFPDYKFEEDPEGCVPKYPLIFEIINGHREYAINILKEDKNIDVNAQDETGSTALHYAVHKVYMDVINALLSDRDILVHIKDSRGRTPIGLARELGNKALARRLASHPNHLLSVAAHRKLTTCWGSLKNRY